MKVTLPDGEIVETIIPDGWAVVTEGDLNFDTDMVFYPIPSQLNGRNGYFGYLSDELYNPREVNQYHLVIRPL